MTGHAKLNTRATRNVLFVGGVADGQWYSIPAGDTTYRIPLPLPLGAIDYDPQKLPSVEMRTHDYRIQPFIIFGRTVWVAIFIHLRFGDDTERAAVRALFQRDVADELMRGQR